MFDQQFLRTWGKRINKVPVAAIWQWSRKHALSVAGNTSHSVKQHVRLADVNLSNWASNFWHQPTTVAWTNLLTQHTLYGKIIAKKKIINLVEYEELHFSRNAPGVARTRNPLLPAN